MYSSLMYVSKYECKLCFGKAFISNNTMYNLSFSGDVNICTNATMIQLHETSRKILN
jgi:hypothetical protein